MPNINPRKDMVSLVNAAKHGKLQNVKEILNLYYPHSDGQRIHRESSFDLSSIYIPNFIYEAIYGALQAAINSHKAIKLETMRELLSIKGINVYAKYNHTSAYELATEVSTRRALRDPAHLESNMMALIKNAGDNLTQSSSSSLSQSSNSTYNVMSTLSSPSLTGSNTIQSPTLTLTRAATSSSVISNNASTASVGEKVKDNHYIQRLKKAGYDDAIPDWLENVISYEIIEDPITIQGQTYDRLTLKEFFLRHIGLDPNKEHSLDTLVTYPANAQSQKHLKDIKIRGPRGEEDLTLLDILMTKTNVAILECIEAFVQEKEAEAKKAAEAAADAPNAPQTGGRALEEGEERLQILQALIDSAQERLAELDGRIAYHESSQSDVIGKGKEADEEDDDASLSEDDSSVSAPVIPPPPPMPQDAVTQEMFKQMCFLAATLISEQVSIANQHSQSNANPTQNAAPQREIDLRASQQDGGSSPLPYFLPPSFR